MQIDEVKLRDHEIAMITSSQHCSMVEKLVHACKVPCACRYVWVIEGTEPKSSPQIHLELFQGIASDLQEVLGSDVSIENNQL